MKSYTTPAGIEITRRAEEIAPAHFDEIISAVESRRGGVLSSGMEYPGRYSRWHMAYVDPCLELSARGRLVTVSALGDRGRVLLPTLATELGPVGEVRESDADHVSVHVPVGEEVFTEEERSRRPTAFTALRAVLRALSCEDEHLGFYGAFGYDLAFQFEPVSITTPRDENDRDLVLHLPDRLAIWDRKRELAHRFDYEFAVGDSSTVGIAREQVSIP